jgi:hypothetical protein
VRFHIIFDKMKVVIAEVIRTKVLLGDKKKAIQNFVMILGIQEVLPTERLIFHLLLIKKGVQLPS